MDERIFGVKMGGLGKNFRSGFKRVAAAFGKGPGNKPTRFAGVAGGEAGGEAGGVLPAARAFEEAKLKFLNPIIGNHLRGKVFQLN